MAEKKKSEHGKHKGARRPKHETAGEKVVHHHHHHHITIEGHGSEAAGKRGRR